MTNTAIASTQQAGQGDAAILGNNSQPIVNTMLSIGAQNKRQQAQEGLLNKKQTQENATKFYSNLGGLKEKIWDADLGRAEEKITALITKAIDYQKKGINPFSPENMGAYADLYGDIEKLQLFQEASKSAEVLYNKGIDLINKDLDNEIDQKAYYESLTKLKNTTPLERYKVDTQPKLSPYDSLKTTKKALDGSLKIIMQNAKILNDKGLVDEVNKSILDNRPAFIQSAIDANIAAIGKGRTTVEDVAKIAGTYFDANIRDAGFDPTKNEDQAFKISKQAEDMAMKKARLGFDKDKEQYARKTKETTPTYAYDALGRVILGGGASTLFNGQDYLDTNYGATKKDGTVIYPTINKVESRITNPDGSIDVVYSLNKPILDESENVTYEKVTVKEPAFDKQGKPTFQNTNLYNSIQEFATTNNKSYSNISGQEVASGKANITPTTANTASGYGNNNKPKTTTPTNTPKKTVVKKGYNSKTNQTQLIYSDGSKEIVNGKR